MEVKGLRLEIRLVMAIFRLQAVLLATLVTMGFMNWFSTDRAPASPPSLEVHSLTAEDVESASALDSPPPASAPASETVERPEGNTAEESQPALAPARRPALDARESVTPLADPVDPFRIAVARLGTGPRCAPPLRLSGPPDRLGCLGSYRRLVLTETT